jgi:hypothetical protein
MPRFEDLAALVNHVGMTSDRSCPAPISSLITAYNDFSHPKAFSAGFSCNETF